MFSMKNMGLEYSTWMTLVYFMGFNVLQTKSGHPAWVFPYPAQDKLLDNHSTSLTTRHSNLQCNMDKIQLASSPFISDDLSS